MQTLQKPFRKVESLLQKTTQRTLQRPEEIKTKMWSCDSQTLENVAKFYSFVCLLLFITN